MLLRKSQLSYAELFLDKVLHQKKVKPLGADLPCNFGKTELIVNYNIPTTIKEYKDEKIIHISSTILAEPYGTFVVRVEGDWANHKDIWYNVNDSSLDALLNNPEMYLKAYKHICVFTTLNKMGGPSKKKFNNLLKIATEKFGFKWCHNRDESDYAGFDSEEHQTFEAGTAKSKTTSGGSKYANDVLEQFETFKDSCLYLLGFSGTMLNAQKGEVHLKRELHNAVSLAMGDSIVKDKWGTVYDELPNWLNDPNKWTNIVSEENFEQMKEDNIEYNSFFVEPGLYHKKDYKKAIKDAVAYTENKQKRVDNLKHYLIDNVSKFYPNVSGDELCTILDEAKKITLIQTGKSGEYATKSFITPTEFISDIEKVKEEFDIESRFLHSVAKIKGTIKRISIDEIVGGKINLLGVCNLLTRGYDIPYISAVLILATSPQMDKKSAAAPYTKRFIQTVGRLPRFDSGIIGAKGLTEIREILSDLGINIRKDTIFEEKFREYIKTNLELKAFLLYDDSSDTATYVVEKLKRVYVHELEFDRVFDKILGDEEIEIEICECCNGTGIKNGHANIGLDMDMSTIDRVLQAAE